VLVTWLSTSRSGLSAPSSRKMRVPPPQDGQFSAAISLIRVFTIFLTRVEGIGLPAVKRSVPFPEKKAVSSDSRDGIRAILRNRCLE
jgi:hypothetical protein